MKTVSDINFKGKKALVRVDFNVPLDDKLNVSDDTRMRAAIPTINKILNDGGSVILLSHLGRPKGGPEDKFSLKHIVFHLSELLGKPVGFADDCIGKQAAEHARSLSPGDVLLLENLRFYKEEEKGDDEFAGKLAALGDLYVNDAFGTAHRAHASTAVIAKFFPGKKCFGYVMSGEIESVKKVMNGSSRPFTAIMGGAKVSDKILILQQLLKKADNIIIGGGMAFTFIKALGGKIGNSLVENDKLDVAKDILTQAKKLGMDINPPPLWGGMSKGFYIPVDAVCAEAFSNDKPVRAFDGNAIPDGWLGLDIGPLTEMKFRDVILQSKTILWNGPMGVFEMSNFESGTKKTALAIAEATSNGTYTLVGGGDSVAAVNKYDLAKKVSYVSTGGGALLEYIESGSLPGIDAVEK